MKIWILSPAILLLTGCLPGQEPNVIQVDGSATIEVEPTNFTLAASLRSSMDSRNASLADVARTYATIKDELPKLEGIEKIKIRTSSTTVETIYDSECQDLRYDDFCPITGYGAAINITVIASPASEAGNMLSLLTELGAESASFSNYGVENMNEAREQAVKAAVENAQYKAELIAKSAGTTIVGPSKIQFGKNFDNSYMERERGRYSDQITVSATRRRPKIRLDIEPEPIAVSAEVVAEFKIE